VKEKVFHNHNLHVLNDANEKIEGSQNIAVLGWSRSKVSKDRFATIDKDDVVQAQNITLQADQTITLKAGGNYITIGPSGITLVGMPMINLNPMGAPPLPFTSMGLPTDPDDPSMG
jgi:type VI secretion system secreted protein VgrG